MIGSWELWGNQSGYWGTKFCRDVAGWKGFGRSKPGQGEEEVKNIGECMAEGRWGRGIKNFGIVLCFLSRGRLAELNVTSGGATGKAEYAETKEQWQFAGHRMRD